MPTTRSCTQFSGIDVTRSRTPTGVRERRVILLGSTGSIGTQTVETIVHLNALAERGESAVVYRVVGLAAGRNVEVLSQQAGMFPGARIAAAHAEFDREGSLTGPDSAERLVREVECDLVLGAMVGAAGLPATLAAVELGRDVALANKETLVAAGALVVPAARRSGAKLLPVDSEHAGVWQCLPIGASGERAETTEPVRSVGGAGVGVPSQDGGCPPMRCGGEVARVVLTASGGPFRTWTREQIVAATPAQALKHPTWSMGQKVTIDSASLTNKALELIEAHWLFGLEPERLGVVIHPQSIVHALVEMSDGNVIAQLAPPDMRTPIQIALTYPARRAGVSRKLDWASLSRLDFEQPDLDRFPALGAAERVMRLGGTAGAVFNAANEAAVEMFLRGEIPFGRIPELSLGAIDGVGVSPLRGLQDVLDADAEARRWVAGIQF